MNVRTLIGMLLDQDMDREVYFSYDSHDYWGSTLASPISDVEENEICYSDYHQKYSVPDRSECKDNDTKSIVVILLS